MIKSLKALARNHEDRQNLSSYCRFALRASACFLNSSNPTVTRLEDIGDAGRDGDLSALSVLVLHMYAYRIPVVLISVTTDYGSGDAAAQSHCFHTHSEHWTSVPGWGYR